jgi:hypothetical protein
MHIHVYSPDGQAKFWLTPETSLAKNHKFSESQIKELKEVVEKRRDEIETAWEKHFRS